MKQNQLGELFNESKDSSEYLKCYSEYLSDLLFRLDYEKVSSAIDCFLQARENGATIFFAGNGGSAATASHFSQDLAEVGKKTGSKLFRTVSLTDNVSFITAMGNDYGYERIFVEQMRNLFRKNDVLVAISASGNSPNVVEAVKFAKDFESISVGLVGFDGGELSRLCDHVLHVSTFKEEYGPVEDIHLILNHMITSFIMYRDIKYKKANNK